MPKKKHQGREITATIQAPTEDQLEMMLHEMNDYCAETGLEPIEILKKGPDPDGGYRAVIIAHNFNPLKWLKERWQARGGGPEERAMAAKERKETALAIRRGKRRAEAREKIRGESARAAAKARAKYAKFPEVAGVPRIKVSARYTITALGKEYSSESPVLEYLIDGTASAEELANMLAWPVFTVREHLSQYQRVGYVRLESRAAEPRKRATAR